MSVKKKARKKAAPVVEPTQPTPQPPMQPQEPPKVVLSEETFNALKQNLVERVRTLYGQFVMQIDSVPMHPQLKMVARGHLDTGFLWLKEAADCLPKQQLEAQLQTVAPIAPPAPDAPQGDNKAAA